MFSSEREEEIFSVQSIYCDAYNTFEVVDDTHFRFRSVPVVLSITLPPSYPGPSHLPEISIDSEGLGVSRLQMFQLKMRLEAIVESKSGELLLFDLTEETREFTEGLRDDVRVSLEEEMEDDEDIWQEDFTDFDERITDQTILRSHMGSHNIEGIMSRLPGVKLLHAEVVLRNDLRRKFLDMQQKIRHATSMGISDRRAKDAAWDKYGQEEIVFHGTLRQNVGSIVRSGFVVPGQKTSAGETIWVRCGSTWGQGIYTSPDPNFSLSYTDYTTGGIQKGSSRLLPGQKLIVCAVLMGRRRIMSEARRYDPTVEHGFHSHISPSHLEYIVFNSAQILPLYVLHLGDGRDPHEIPMPLNANQAGLVYFEGNLTEYARKHLPDGFGAARGHKFVVEAIAPIDDDEELWGEFQYDDDKGEFQTERWAQQWSYY